MTKKISKMSDEECLKRFIEFLETRISITTGFIPDEDTGVLTRQFLKITCGDHASFSQPELLPVPLVPASADEVGESLN